MKTILKPFTSRTCLVVTALAFATVLLIILLASVHTETLPQYIVATRDLVHVH